MKNNLIILIGLMILLLFGGLGYLILSNNNNVDNNGNELTGFVKEWGKEEIIIGLDNEYPPMTFVDESGEIVGFDVDFAREAFGRIGLKPVFKPMDWSTIVLSLQNRDIDVVWSGMTITDERLEKINFSKPYFKGLYVYISSKGESLKSKQDLASKVVGVQAGSSNEEALRADPIFSQLKELRTYSTFQEALMDLDLGRIDTMYSDGVFAYYYINQKGKSYSILDEKEEVSGAGVGIRKEDEELKEYIDNALDEMKKDGTAKEISKKWFGTDFIYY